MNSLERKILDISYKKGLSHIGSCLSSVKIIDYIFQHKKTEDKFILSSGHCGLALYVVQEQYGHNAEYLFNKCGVHPDRMLAPEAIDCSTGSLGIGITIATGMAFADRTKKVFCLISDGECMEGSVYESLNVKKKYNLDNLIVYMNYNSFGAYDEISKHLLPGLQGVIVVDTSQHWFIKRYGQEGHYKALNKTEYENIINEKEIL